MSVWLWVGWWLFAASAFTIVWIQERIIRGLTASTRCDCGRHKAVIPVCVEVDGWHHCRARCRPLHEEVQP